MSQVPHFQDHEVVRHLLNEFEAWSPDELDAEYFLRKVKHLHEQWILSRFGRFIESKETWRFLMATFERQVSKMRDNKQEPQAPAGMSAEETGLSEEAAQGA